MTHLGDLLTVALGVVSIATLAGLGLLRGTVTNLREQLKDARDEAAALRASRADDHTRIATMNADLAALQRVVTGEVHWVALGHQLEEHDQAARTHWERDEEILTDIRDELRRQTP